MKKINSTLFFLGLLFFTFTRQAEAESFSVGIYPPIIEVIATAPSEPAAKITLQNLNDAPATLDILLKPIREKKNGEISYVKNPQETSENTFFSHVHILEGGNEVKEVRLEALSEKELTVTFDIDQTVSKHDYYFSVIFLSRASSRAVSIPAGIATNVIVSVGPQGETTGAIRDFSTRAFYERGPVAFSLLIENQSDHFITPRGTVRVTNMFGQDVAKLEIPAQYVLSRSSRYVGNQFSRSSDLTQKLTTMNLSPRALVWPENFLFGYYTAAAQISATGAGPLLSASTHFIAIPVAFLAGLIVSLIVLLGLSLRVKKKI